MLRLSVLDQSTVVTGRSPDASIRESLALARHCESLGYARYWVAEHHNSASIAGTAPEVLIAAIAATTTRIRVGSAGVMLPHYAALKVAEQFRVLEAIAPGRIDLGLGRAPGSDGRTAYALNPLAETAAAEFPAQVRDLMAWVAGEPLVAGHPFHDILAQPQGPTTPEVWMLGSSDYGAQVAAYFGLPFCFAHFITDGRGAEEAPVALSRRIPPQRASSRPACRHLRLGAGGRHRGGGGTPVRLPRALAARPRPGRVRGPALAGGGARLSLFRGRTRPRGTTPRPRDLRHGGRGGDAAAARWARRWGWRKSRC